jgi:hypothetical protein
VQLIWGKKDFGGTNVPAGSGYTKIYANNHAFVAPKADGSIKSAIKNNCRLHDFNT